MSPIEIDQKNYTKMSNSVRNGKTKSAEEIRNKKNIFAFECL